MNRRFRKDNILFYCVETLIAAVILAGVFVFFAALKRTVPSEAEQPERTVAEALRPSEIIVPETEEVSVIRSRIRSAVRLHPEHVEVLNRLLDTKDPEPEEGDQEKVPTDELADYASVIKGYMDERQSDNIESRGAAYETLEQEVRDDIDFYESLLLNEGESEETADAFFDAYERILAKKEPNESIVESSGDEPAAVKESYRKILADTGIVQEGTMETLALAFSHDEKLYESSDIESLREAEYLPYELGVTTRENMMLAAMSVVGRVPYVWGGGHGTESYLRGIDPQWEQGKGGLDCSGYMSWLFNQILDESKISTTARYFTEQACLQELLMGEELLPGDVLAWRTHVVGVVGKVREGSRAYVTIEEVPDVLRFGVAYYSDASGDDIDEGVRIAREANALIGGIDPAEEPPRVCCIDKSGIRTDKYYEEIIEEEPETSGEEDDGEVRAEAVSEEEEPSEEVSAEAEVEEEVSAESGDSEEEAGVWEETVSEEEVSEGEEEETEESGDPEEEKEKKTHVTYIEWHETVNTMHIGFLRNGFDDENTPVDESGRLLKDMDAVEIIGHTISKLPVSYLDGYGTYDGELWPEFVSVDREEEAEQEE